jgi:hypothetical protein
MQTKQKTQQKKTKHDNPNAFSNGCSTTANSKAARCVHVDCSSTICSTSNANWRNCNCNCNNSNGR